MSDTNEQRMICPECGTDIKKSYYSGHKKTKKHLKSVQSGVPATIISTQSRRDYYVKKNLEYKALKSQTETDEERKKRQTANQQKNRLARKQQQAKPVVVAVAPEPEPDQTDTTDTTDTTDPVCEELFDTSSILSKTVQKNIGNVRIVYRIMFGEEWDCKLLYWLNDVDTVVEKLRTAKFGHNNKVYKESTVKTILSSIAAVLRDKKGFEKTQAIYSKLSTNSNRTYVENRNLGELSENEQKKSQPWDDILELKKNIYTNGTDVDFALYSLYTEIPPRRAMDYRLLRVVRNKPVDTVMKLSQDFNYIVFDKRNNVKALIINKYKAGPLEKYGRYVLTDIPKQLSKAVQRPDLNSGDFLFHPDNNRSSPLSESSYSTMVSDLFKKFSDIPSDVNMLRHSYASKYFSRYRTVAEVKKTALMMGTSSSELANYVRTDLVDEVFK